jgi:hypothetical protein
VSRSTLASWDDVDVEVDKLGRWNGIAAKEDAALTRPAEDRRASDTTCHDRRSPWPLVSNHDVRSGLPMRRQRSTLGKWQDIFSISIFSLLQYSTVAFIDAKMSWPHFHGPLTQASTAHT